MRSCQVRLQDGDILVVKHKVVSKSEGSVVALDEVRPSTASRIWAGQHGLDPRVSELALRESRRIVRQKHGVLITETKHGFVCANSGVDVSNVDGGRHAVVLPVNPDASATKLRREFKRQTGIGVAVIVSDSFGRPWREGLTEVAIGVAGMRPLVDYRGRRDPHGYSLHATVDAVADELACAAGLVCGKLESTPACIIRGYSYRRGNGSAREMIRSPRNDLFR
jgi:coenzyme F420-0:L-glutamate ligase/coenzyme F420-1:gamma-L-glutamate ligase